MYLKRLELQGFKSFPDKVRLEFNKGITTVVGPNGSGKSNISDSVRWVLGEQKVKSLRGDKMEDIIFAGTQNRKPLGFAEVSITIDNQDHKMPIDYTEVTVTRRVFRSGDSDYLINGTHCRLKDVYELFMDTGIGREGYSIIGQGKIDEILSSKSDDRRRLFEEAAGIVKFKNRKLEAEAKLEREKQNLIRIQDIISELESQVQPLEEQSAVAKKYLEQKERLKVLEVNIFRIQADKLEQDLKELMSHYEIAFSQTKQEEENYQAMKEESTKFQQQSDQISLQLQAANDEIIAIRSEIEKKESDIKLTEEQIEHICQDVKRLETEISSKQKKLANSQNELQLFETKLDAVEVNKIAQGNLLSEKEEEFASLSKALSENESQMETYKSDIIEKMKVLTNIKESISRTQTMLEQFETRKEQLTEEVGYLNSQIHDNKTHLDAASYRIENFQKEKDAILFHLKERREEKESLSKEIFSIEQEIKIHNRVLTEKKSRYRILSEMEKEHEGFFKSVKEILKKKQQQHPDFLGVHGALGELLSVEKDYETAIEIALGNSIQNIVTSTQQDAKAAISYLKENNLGRATFLPIASIKAKEFSDKAKILSEPGVIGVASELVDHDKQYSNIIRNLLGRVIIIENMDYAIAFSKKYQYSYKVVTLAGEVFHAGGSMTGGSIVKKATNVFGRSREIKTLKEEIGISEQKVNKLSAHFTAYQKSLEENTLSIEQLQEDARQLELKEQSAKQDLEQTKQYLSQQEEKLRLYHLEQTQLEKQQEHVEKNAVNSRQQLEQTETEIRQINESLESFQNSMSSDKSTKEELLDMITKIKISLSNYEQNEAAIHETIQRIEKEQSELEEEINNCREEILSYQQSKKEKSQVIVEIQQWIQAQKQIEAQKQNNVVVLADQKRDCSQKITQISEEIAQRLETVSKLKNELFRLDTKKENISKERQRIYQEVWEEYEITYQKAKEYEILADSFGKLQNDCKQLRQQIRDLGSVNVDAIEKYKQVKERLTFMTEQKDDILEAEQKLHTVIQELSELMKQQFKEQFALISENFNVVFREMFGGGKAYLKLSDEENVLESGIEIIAQPPGKNLQNMMLLSGGERALTAIAILFSILKMKPSPFCILDEIEAALDDANVKRFAHYLKRFSGDTQFIVITHRKGTMEAADVMYGVTMQEQGVSKLVSVKFDERAV